jgi:hypothetical protein
MGMVLIKRSRSSSKYALNAASSALPTITSSTTCGHGRAVAVGRAVRCNHAMHEPKGTGKASKAGEGLGDTLGGR